MIGHITTRGACTLAEYRDNVFYFHIDKVKMLSVDGYKDMPVSDSQILALRVHVDTIKELQGMFDGASVRVRCCDAPRPWNVMSSIRACQLPPWTVESVCCE